ncbi:GlxA family transcriptional regulator [Alphaproteobacteria bacterium]|nr:GlxA family transcriptional regulator [Alphaproteobacteria bacterium]
MTPDSEQHPVSVSSSKTHLGFLIFPGFPMSCLTSMIEPLRAANEIAGQDRFGWQLISEDGARILASAGVYFDPDVKLADAESLDFMFCLSEPMAHFKNEQKSNGILRQLARHGTRMGGVSGGVFPLARAGLMDTHPCSVHWCYKAAFEAEFSHIKAVDDVIVTDPLRFSASGAAAAFDMMLHLIEQEFGAPVMTEVACWFQHPLVRGEGVRQRIPAFYTASADDMLPPAIQQAVHLFASHIEESISVSDVAEAVGLSARQLERGFKKVTGQSPSHYYRLMRMKAARQLVLYSNDTLKDIAFATGYNNAASMITHYKAAFGITPKEERNRINLFRVQNNRSLPSI